MSKKTTIAAAVGSALALTLAAAPAAADQANPFGMSDLSSGYQQVAEGKCGGNKGHEGNCGAKKAHEAKCGEGKKHEAKCGEGKCGAKKKAKKHGTEAKCGEAKCGGKK